MANTFKKIQTVTVGAGGSSTIAFTSIPQTYTDLKVVLSVRSDRNSGTQSDFQLRFNSASANYSRRTVQGSGSAATSISGSAESFGSIGVATQDTDTASVFGSSEVYIPNYTSANFKSYSADTVRENNATSGYQGLVAGLWSDTAAITSITFYVESNTQSFKQYSTATLYGVSNVPAAGNAKATGGIITYDDTYVYHTFPWSGTFTPLTSLTADYLVVAGGGSGGNSTRFGGAGGGGGGGVRCTVGATGGGGTLESALSLTATAYTVTVGAGGAGATGAPLDGTQSRASGTAGSNSVFATITSTGGGGGGGREDAGVTGGSGGGGGASNGSGAGGARTASPVQGFAGGTGNGSATTNDRAGAGGGGGSVAGTNAGTGTGGAGGNGVTTSISGTSTVYAGGGGGNRGAVNSNHGSGGTGGGTNGSYDGSSSASANTGGGSGAAGGVTGGTGSGNGGSGIVIVRYAK
jgi:hypothetical protein